MVVARLLVCYDSSLVRIQTSLKIKWGVISKGMANHSSPPKKYTRKKEERHRLGSNQRRGEKKLDKTKCQEFGDVQSKVEKNHPSRYYVTNKNRK